MRVEEVGSAITCGNCEVGVETALYGIDKGVLMICSDCLTTLCKRSKTPVAITRVTWVNLGA